MFNRGGLVLTDTARDVTKEYELDAKRIGQGTYGTVSKALCKKSKQLRACKNIPKAAVKDTTPLKQEVDLMKNLDHPNIVKLLEIFEDAKSIYLIQELCQGGELFERIIEMGSFSEKQAGSIIKQLVSAVSYLHSHGIVHRDLKPENILFLAPKDLQIKLIDFGLATKIPPPGKFLTEKVGTPYYVSPQVLSGSYNEKADVFSCGVIMYTILCGYPPFYGDTDAEILKRIRAGKYTFPDQEWAAITPDAKDLINKMLTYEPEKRLSAEKSLKHFWLENVSTMDEKSVKTMSKDFIASLRSFTAASRLKKVALTAIAMQVNDKEIETLRKAFQSLDTNSDGTLTIAEIKEGISKVGVKMPDDVEAILQSLDSDGSGSVDYTEFIAATIDRKTYLREETCWAAFRVFDLDGNGKITLEEFKTVLSRDALKNAFTDDQIKSMIKEADANGDGEIDFDELMAIMKV
jgi:calcium-dependent protein kinase